MKQRLAFGQLATYPRRKIWKCRQGCPLAPLLFILAVDTIFRRIEASPTTLGILIPTSHDPRRVPIAGYADDIALYLNGPEDEEAFLAILVEFGLASGLKLNEKKCIAVCLHPNGPNSKHSTLRIQPSARTHATRYLGAPLSSLDMAQAGWDVVRKATQIRLLVATQKPTDPFQRARRIEAVAIL